MVSHQRKSTNNKARVIANAVAAKVGSGVAKRAQPRKRRVRRPRVNNRGPNAVPTFGPVATIDTAPVSIGNTVRGSTPIVIPTIDGVRVKGRDFLLTCSPTSTSFTGWQVVGGAPITPACMVASVLKSYSQMYAQYCVHAVAFHFVTAAITTDAGSIMMYIAKNRTSPGLNPSSANLLPFVMSDEHTTISPIWKNTSAVFNPVPAWYTTDLMNDEPLEHQACGELFVLSKITQADSPGYILMDYDISFREHQTNIKNVTLPASRVKYSEITLATGTITATINSTVISMVDNGNNLMDGATGSGAPVGAVVGDIYKTVMTTNGATLSGVTTSTLFNAQLGNGNYGNVEFTDGFTAYAVYVSTNTFIFYPTYIDAVAGSKPYLFGTSNGGGNIGVLVHAFMSLVGSVGSTLLQASY